MDSVQSSPQAKQRARVPVAHPMLAMMGMLIGGFVGMFSETSLNIALPIDGSATRVNGNCAMVSNRLHAYDWSSFHFQA